MRLGSVLASILLVLLIPRVGLCETSLYYDSVGKTVQKNFLIVRFFPDAAYALAGQVAMTRIDFKSKAATFLVPAKMIGAPLLPLPAKFDTALTTESRTFEIEVDGVKKTLSCQVLRVVDFPKSSECVADLAPFLKDVRLADFLTVRDTIDALKLVGIYRKSHWGSVMTSAGGVEMRLRKIASSTGMERGAVFNIKKYKISPKACAEADCKKMLPGAASPHAPAKN